MGFVQFFSSLATRLGFGKIAAPITAGHRSLANTAEPANPDSSAIVPMALTAATPARTVRVLRSSGSTGRLVISGRMADVCAELERMAARESLA